MYLSSTKACCTSRIQEMSVCSSKLTLHLQKPSQSKVLRVDQQLDELSSRIIATLGALSHVGIRGYASCTNTGGLVESGRAAGCKCMCVYIYQPKE